MWAYILCEFNINLLSRVLVTTEEDPIAFESVARGIEKFDVCRYFLASLHLANEGRVVIVKDNEERMLLKPVM